jgi:sialic acid synthase SpsE
MKKYDNKVFVIAEAGANHNRDWETAKSLVRAAHSAKADAVKFQTYSSNTLYSKYTPPFAGYEDIPKLIRDIELPRSWQRDLKLYCDDLGIEFMSTPFDERAVEELYELGVKRLKIAGFESTDPRWVKHVASTGLPLIISMGTGANYNTMLQIQEWILGPNIMNDPKIHLETFDSSNNQDITYLHCNSAYPTPLEDANLGNLKHLKRLSENHKCLRNTKIGLSDHTEGILVPPLAVALGAQVIEKHYTLSRASVGPDHPFAIEPDELKQMVSNIRCAEQCLGVKEGIYTESEKVLMQARRSVVAARDIAAGEILSRDNITTKRPCLENSIPAIDYFDVLGKRTSKNIKEDTILTTKDLK